MQFYKNHKEWMLTIFVAGLAAFTVISALQLWPARSTVQSYADTLRSVQPYVVSIYTQTKQPEQSLSLLNDPLLSQYITTIPKSSLGSGILLGRDGLVVTNAHVIRDAHDIVIKTIDGRQVPALEYWLDDQTDIALIKTGVQIDRALPTQLTQSTLVGDIVFTLGNPLGIGQSVSMGIISATDRQQSTLTQLTDFIQTDAAINPGNSGGALVNSLGKVIGMNTAILSTTAGSRGIGFAIPIDFVLKQAKELEQHPSIQPNKAGFIGIDVIEDTQAKRLRIVSLKANSPAQQSGLMVGDLIVEIDGSVFTSRQALINYIHSQPIAKLLQFEILRGEQQVLYQVPIAPK